MTKIETELKQRIQVLEAEIERLKRRRPAENGDQAIYQRFVENAVMGIYRSNRSGQLLMVNHKIAEMFGFASTEEVFATIGNVIEFYADPTKRGEFIQEIEEKGYAVRRDVALKKKNGESMWAEIHACKVTDEDGEIVYEGFIQEVTDRIRAETKLRLTQQCLEKATIGILRVGADARILDVNDQACINLGYTRQELCRMTVFDIDPEFNPERWPKHQQALEARGSMIIESVHQNKDGLRYPVEILINLLRYENDHYHVAFVQDISERRQAERLKAQLLQSQKMEAIGQLAGGIAHDFNNILGAIMGYVQLAQLSSPSSREERNYLEMVFDASQRAKNLVQQILTFSRQAKTEKIPADISVVIKEAIKMIRPILPATIDIEQNIGVNLGAVLVDQTQIHQVIMNLCTNAYHAMKDKGGRLSVTLSAAIIGDAESSALSELRPGKYVQLTVADTGHGIDPKNLPHIFEPYFTTKEIDEGSGIGLATVYGIVKDHNGAIKVYSEPGLGTTFHVYFPLVRSRRKVSDGRATRLPTGTETILFVDDETALVEIGRDMLHRLGYTVEYRTNSLDALAAFESNPGKYQLVVTDMTMPNMSGKALARAVKKIRPDVPIILCSGFSVDFHHDVADDPFVDKALMKPLTIHDLAHAVRALLDSGRP